MKILVVGASGYIGTHLVALLKKLTNHKVFAASRKIKKDLDGHITYVSLDISDEKSVEAFISSYGVPDTLIDLAWIDGFSHQSIKHIDCFRDHYKFCTNLIDLGCKNISIIGTMHEIGFHVGVVNQNTVCKPLSLYGIAKSSLRESLFNYIIINDKKVNLKWLRTYYITGDDIRNNSIFKKIIIANERGETSFPFTDGLNEYDFIDVDELALQIAISAIQEDTTGIIECCSGKPLSLKSRVEQFLRDNQIHLKLNYGAFPSRKYDSPCIYGDKSKIEYILNAYGDITKLLKGV